MEQWFLDEPQEVARLPHFMFTPKAITLKHEGLNAEQVALLDGIVFPGIPYEAANTNYYRRADHGSAKVALYVPDDDPKWLVRNPGQGARYWYERRRPVFAYNKARNELFVAAGLTGRLMTRAVLRRHLIMLCDFDGGVGDARVAA